MPIPHVGLTVTDLEASTEFYLSALAPLGYKVFMQSESKEFIGLAVQAPDFWLFAQKESKHGAEKEGPPPAHVAFEGSSQKIVDAFHAAALKAGGTCNGPPGERPQYTAGYYAAYVLDVDGNNIECVYYNPWWLAALKQAPYILGAVAAAGAWYVGKRNIF